MKEKMCFNGVKYRKMPLLVDAEQCPSLVADYIMNSVQKRNGSYLLLVAGSRPQKL